MQEISQNIKIILKKIPNQSFEVLSTFKSDFFSGVFVVENKKLSGRIEDIKIIETFDPEQKKQFEKEAIVLSLIENQNIPMVYDLLEYNDYIFFRSQHIEGYSLREILNEFQKREEFIPKIVILNIIGQLAKSLYYMHNEVKYKSKQESIIHCDIKPENIIIKIFDKKRKNKIDDDVFNLIKNNKIQPYLIDFGIAKFKEKEEIKNGTLNYMSLEQIKNKKITWKTDVYQLSLIYDEMLCNKKPYDLLERYEIIKEKRENDYKNNSKKELKKKNKDYNNLKYKRLKDKKKRENIKNRNNNKIVSKYTAKSFFNKDSKLTEDSFLYRIKKEKTNETIKNFFIKNKNNFIFVFILMFLFLFGVFLINFYDEKFESTNAILLDINKISNISVDELNFYLDKLQIRTFKKHYLESLLNGEFKEEETDELLYPNRIDKNGDWIYSTIDNTALGYFNDIIMNYNEEFSLDSYSQSYVNFVYNIENDSSGEMKYFYGLKNYYEKTNEKKYLDKIEERTLKMLKDMNSQKGLSRFTDLNFIKVALWLYNKTENESYLENSLYYMDSLLNNNINKDGSAYDYSQINFSIPNGMFLPDCKMNRLLVNYEEFKMGSIVLITDENKEIYENKTGVFTRDYLDFMNVLYDVYNVTKDNKYMYYLVLMEDYYSKNSKSQDKLLLTLLSEEENPIDNLALIRAVEFYKKYDIKKYKEKLIELLQEENFRNENEKGIIKKIVYIEGNFYNPDDKSLNEQSLIIADNEFIHI